MKRRTISLTHQAPVSINEEKWPVIAYGSDFSGKIKCQANEEWSVRVRRHADGRAIVYAVRDSGPGGMPAGWHGARTGEIVPADADVADAIQRVGTEAEIPEHVIADCIQSLPAVEI